MKKPELIDAIAARSELTKNDTSKFLDAFVETVVNAMCEGEEVNIYGLGTFLVIDQAERKSRNPKTGEYGITPAKKKPKMKISQSVKNAVNIK